MSKKYKQKRTVRNLCNIVFHHKSLKSLQRPCRFVCFGGRQVKENRSRVSKSCLIWVLKDECLSRLRVL